MTSQLMPYDALAVVYDRWTEGNDYNRWAGFVVDRFKNAGRPVHHVLDLCCGTGAITRRLRDAGWQVTGVDASAAMIEQARASGLDDVEFVHGALPDVELPSGMDGAVCTFDSLNYLAGDGEFAATLAAVGAALRESGVFVFDLNSRRKLVELLGNSHYGDDQGDFAYIWRNRLDEANRCVEFLITLFLRNGDRDATAFGRFEERHRQRWFPHDEIIAAATEAGFVVVDVVDDYGDVAAGEQAFRETWVLRKARP
jgi:SAM-dependent methyltransferase